MDDSALPKVFRIIDFHEDLLSGKVTLADLNCEGVSITYQTYSTICSGLEVAGCNIQETLPPLLTIIDNSCILPLKISNLTRKVNRFISKAKANPAQYEELIQRPVGGLIQSVDRLSEDFTEAGVTLSHLLEGTATIQLEQPFQMQNGHVLELRKILNRHHMSWVTAVDWLYVLMKLSAEDRPLAESVRSQWNGLHEHHTKLLLKKKNDNHLQFLGATYKVPVKKLQTPDKKNDKLEKKCQHLEQNLQEAYQKTSELKKDFCDLLSDCASLQGRICDQKQLQSQCEAAQKSVDAMKKTTRELQKEKSSLTTRNLQKRIKTRNVSIEKKSQELLNKQNELCAAQDLARDLNNQIESLSHEKLNLQKVKSFWKTKCLSEKSGSGYTDDQINEMRQQIDELREQVEELREPEKENNEICFLKDGKTYNDRIRQVYMDLQSMNVSVGNCQHVVRSVLENLIMGVQLGKLPKKSLSSLISVEAEVLSQKQAGEAMLSSVDATLHTDGTKKRFTEYSGFQVSLQGGCSYSLGIQEMVTGDTDNFIEATVSTLEEIAESVSEGKDLDLVKAKLLSSIRNLMTDRHIVNKVYLTRLEQLRASLLPKVYANWDTFSGDEKLELTKMNGLFCGLHLLPNMASGAKTGLLVYERQTRQENPAGSEAQTKGNTYSGLHSTYDLVFQCCKALTRGGDAKSGHGGEFAAYLADLGKKCRLLTFVHNRFNILFHDGGAVYHHRAHISEFLKSGVLDHSNKLLDAISASIDNPMCMAGCRALGIIGKLLCGPLWRKLEENNVAFFSMNPTWVALRDSLKQLAGNAQPLLDAQAVLEDSSITKDEIYTSLFPHQVDANCKALTKLALESVCSEMLKIVERQLRDQLPGGKMANPDPAVLDQVMSAPLTNRISEADFSDLDRAIHRAPQKSTKSKSGLICYVKNKTGIYLKNLSSAQKERHFIRAMKLARKRRKQGTARVLSIRHRRILMQKERKQKKECLMKKKANLIDSLKNRIKSKWGIWTSEAIINKKLDELPTGQKMSSVKDQISYHEKVLKSNQICNNVDLFKWQKQGQKHSLVQLVKQLVTIVSEVWGQETVPTDIAAVNDNLVVAQDKLPGQASRKTCKRKRATTKSSRKCKRQRTESTSSVEEPSAEESVVQYQVGQYVAVAFEDTFYVGQIIKLDSVATPTVRFMEQVGCHYKWPSPEYVVDTHSSFILNVSVDVCSADSMGRIWNVRDLKEIQKIYKAFLRTST